MENLLILKNKIDNLYNKCCNGNQDILDELDNLMLEILKYDNLNVYSLDEVHQIVSLIGSIIEKINLIYEILDVKRDNLLTLDYLKEEFLKLEIKKFFVLNNYVMGILTLDVFNEFKEKLLQFRNMLYAIPISDNNIIEIAKIKSKIQHFNTEVLEDEDVLKQAYENSN